MTSTHTHTHARTHTRIHCGAPRGHPVGRPGGTLGSSDALWMPAGPSHGLGDLLIHTHTRTHARTHCGAPRGHPVGRPEGTLGLSLVAWWHGNRQGRGCNRGLIGSRPLGVLSRGRSCFVSGTGCGGPGVPRPHAVRGSGAPPQMCPPTPQPQVQPEQGPGPQRGGQDPPARGGGADAVQTPPSPPNLNPPGLKGGVPAPRRGWGTSLRRTGGGDGRRASRASRGGPAP